MKIGQKKTKKERSVFQPSVNQGRFGYWFFTYNLFFQVMFVAFVPYGGRFCWTIFVWDVDSIPIEELPEDGRFGRKVPTAKASNIGYLDVPLEVRING